MIGNMALIIQIARKMRSETMSVELKKVIISLLLGFAGFFGAFYSYQFDIFPLTISLIWSYCFPLIAAIAFGRWYGLLAGFFGLAALFPFFIWSSDGWANLITVFLLLFWFFWHGYCAEKRSIEEKIWNHPLIVQIPYALFYGLVTYILFPLAFSYNPPFWQAIAITSISSALLLSLVIKATIMMYMNLIVADTVIMIPSVRRFFGLIVREKNRKNGSIILISVSISIIIWVTFVTCIEIFIAMEFPHNIIDFSDPCTIISFFIFIPSGFLLGGILARYFETKIEVEDLLRQSEERFHSLYEHMTEGVALHTLIYNDAGTPVDYQILDVNASYEKILELQRQDVIGKKGTTAYNQDEPPFLAAYIKTVIIKEASSFEEYIGWLDKTLLISVSPIGKEGFAIIFSDITERKKSETALIESEEKCRILVEHAPEAIVVIDVTSNRFIEANIQAEHLFLCTREELLSSAPQNFYPLYQADSKPDTSFATMMSKRYEQALAGEEVVFERIVRNRAGEEILCEERLVRLPSTKGDLLRASLTNISERIRVVEGLAQATKKLNLLSMITCTDIQNSIFGLYAYIELVQEYITDDFLKSLVQKQITLINKTQKILNFTKNYQDLGLKPPLWQNVNHVFLYAISHLDISHLNRRIHLDNLFLFADPLLEKILYSLVENVVNHAQTATEIVFEYQIRPDNSLILIFADNGPGILDSQKERIFERSLEIKGGMSLFLAREMLSITGISITETGVNGEGARFEMAIKKGGYRFSAEEIS